MQERGEGKGRVKPVSFDREKRPAKARGAADGKSRNLSKGDKEKGGGKAASK